MLLVFYSCFCSSSSCQIKMWENSDIVSLIPSGELTGGFKGVGCKHITHNSKDRESVILTKTIFYTWVLLMPSYQIILGGEKVLKWEVKIILSMTILWLFQPAEEVLTKASKKVIRHGFWSYRANKTPKETILKNILPIDTSYAPQMKKRESNLVCLILSTSHFYNRFLYSISLLSESQNCRIRD